MSDTGTARTSMRGARTITAFFDTGAAAQRAVGDLVAAGVARDRITFLEGRAHPVPEEAKPESDKGFWATLKDLFLSEEDRPSYEEGLHRGGTLLAVRDDGTLHDRIVDILDQDGTIDMNAQEDIWRSEGWDPTRAARDVAGARALAGGSVPASEGRRVAPAAATDLGAAVPTEELREAYKGAPDTPLEIEGEPIPEDERTPGRVRTRDRDLDRARVRSYLEEGL